MFSEIRVTQMAAYLLKKQGGRMAYLKLLKLLYLVERQAMAKWGEPISGDSFVSMPQGPVLSQTYDLIKNDSTSPWCHLIKGDSNWEVSLVHEISIDDLDELSPAEIKIIDQVFEEFGKMSRFEIVKYTHDNCKEWQDPHGSSYPIKPESVYRAMGKNENQVKKLLKKYSEQRQLESLKAQLV